MGNARRRWSAGLCVVLLAIAACGERAVDKSPAPPATTAVAAPSALTDALAPRYEATLAEGIDFRKRGYPNFVAEISGISGFEEWGRWSDAGQGASVRIRFREPLPVKFTLEITASAFGPNLGQPMRVRVGQAEQSFTHGDPLNPGSYRLKFELSAPADAVEIVPPKPISPAEVAGTQDVRKIGVGLVALKVID